MTMIATTSGDGHDVSMVLNPPATVLRIAERLERSGFETWCVGGAVRDALLGYRHADWDLATAARPDQVMRLFRRTVPVGVAHGTVGVLDRDNALHEVTTFRHDVRTDGRHAVVEFGASLDEDLARRDLTINAIAYSASRRVLHDPFDGRGDLTRRLIRAVGKPDDRMREDRLRALRAMRFAARFEFEIDKDTWNAIVASAGDLNRLSAERVKEELSKIMDQVARPSRAISLWRDSGALGVLVPALAHVDPVVVASLDYLARPARGVGARGAARSDARRLARLAALFVGHSADDTRRSLRSLRFSNQYADWIAGLAGAWAQVGNDIERTLLDGVTPTDTAVRRWVAAAGLGWVASLLRVASARWTALRDGGAPAPTPRQVGALYRRMMRSAFSDALGLADLGIDGDDLIDAGIAPGREIGEILKRLLVAVIADPSLNERDKLLALAARYAAGAN
jgi:tRNA nucleotidyltransferase (CCA-adding enzyme)